MDKIVIERHPSKIDKDGRRHYLIHAIPYQDPQQGAERLKAVHKARGQDRPQSLSTQSTDFPRGEILGFRVRFWPRSGPRGACQGP